jgi:zinc protease
MKNLKLLFILILAGFVMMSVSAQITDPGKPIPVDPNIKTGKLDNGMTYYIKPSKGWNYVLL